MTAEGDEAVYPEMLVHPAMTTAPAISDVLVIGGGDGGTVREVLRYPGVKRVTLVEIDELVVEACQRHLPSIGTAWDDPRLEVRFDDGARFLAQSPGGRWDVLLVDGADPVGPGAALFEPPFFTHCARVLRPDGVLAAQTGSPTAQFEEHIVALRIIGDRFEQVRPLYAPVGLYPGGAWSWTLGTSGIASLDVPRPDRLATLDRECEWYNKAIHLGALAVPNRVAVALGPGWA